MSKGKLLIFSAPSGSGKTTLVKHLLERCPNLSFSISATSRAPRSNEVNGKDYYFISAKEFKQRIENREFLEWEEVYTDTFYGTLISEVEQLRDKGINVIFDVDVKGGMNIKKFYGDEALSIFVEVKSIDILRQRLQNRSSDSEESIKKRLDKALSEMQYAPCFDITILNDDLKEAQDNTYNIVSNFLKQQ